MAPQLVRLIIGDCVSELTSIVERFGGCVTAHMGDGIAAFFGLHGAHEDDPQRASVAALEMVEAVESFASEVATAWGADDFSIRIGINAGRVATARIGSAEPAKHALGDPVNVAARLQALAPRNGVLIGREAVLQLDERFEREQLAPLSVKGREQRVSAWELCAFKPSVKRDLSVVPLIGRVVECRVLESVAADVLAGRGQILLLTGEAGIGKSRLLAEFRRMLGGEALWLEASCTGQGIQAPFQPIGDLVRNWLGLSDGIPSVAVRVQLQHALEALGLRDFEDVVAGFEWLLAAGGPGRRDLAWDEQPSPEAIRAEIGRAVSRWFRHLAAKQPVVVALEDVEKVDNSARSMIGEVMDLADCEGLSLAIALRPDSYSEGWAVRVKALAEYAHRSREISVLPLTSDAIRELVALLDEAGHLPEEVHDQVVRVAEGNPLFAEELYRSFREHLTVDGFNRTEEEDLPVGLEGLLLARIDRLSPKTRSILQCGAAVGRIFSIELVRDALGLLSIEESVRELVRSGIIAEEGRYPEVRYAFRHGLFKEAALSTLLPEHRQSLHRHIAIALEAHPERNESLASLAHHLAVGELWERASSCFVEAAVDALQVDAVEEALELLERGKDAAQQVEWGARCPEAGLMLARLRIERGETEQAVGVYRDILEGLEDRRCQEVYGEMARCMADAGDLEGAHAVLREAVAREPQVSRDIHLLYAAAHVAFREGRYEAVVQILRELEECFHVDAVTSTNIAQKQAWLWGGYYAVRGEFVSAQIWTVERRELAVQAGDAVGVLEANKDLGVVLLCQGSLQVGVNVLARVVSEAERLGYKKQACGAVVNLLHGYWLSGNLIEGIRLADRVVRWPDVPAWYPEIMGNAGGIYLAAGKLDPAESCYHLAGKGLDLRNGRLASVGVDLGLSMLQLRQGELRLAEEGLREVVGELDCMDSRLEHRSWARVAVAEIAMALGQREAAEREAMLALKDAERAELPARVAPTRVLGMAQEAREAGAGRSNLEAALRLAREMGMRLEEGRALAALARFGLGDEEGLLREARQIFEECGAQPDLEALEEQKRAARAGAV